MKIDVKSGQILPNFGMKSTLLLRAILYIEGQYYENCCKIQSNSTFWGEEYFASKSYTVYRRSVL